MYIYNTQSRQKEQLKPLSSKKEISFYQCGPTVYWTQHIGNLRAMTMGDLLVRTLRYLGYTVKHVRNYTDVGHLTSDSDFGEDKMEKGARLEGSTPKQVADKYIRIFEKDTKALNILEPSLSTRATDYIPEMIAMVEILIKKGFAYTTDLAVYFDVAKFPNYTRLSGQKLEENLEGAGHADVTDVHKHNSMDFALWFFRAGVHQKALQYWPSSFKSSLVKDGEGFPGWHIECSAMIKKELGETIDIHMGGIEHIPVHHTNEIAQSEAANGVPFVNYWVHNEHLLVANEKMAKSEGTGYSLDEVIEEGYQPLALRYFFLQAQYRSQQNFRWEALQGAENALSKLSQEIVKLIIQKSRPNHKSESKMPMVKVDWKGRFVSALEDDLNVPQALAVVWELIDSNETPETKLNFVIDFDEVLGLSLKDILTYKLPKSIQEIADKIHALRMAKKYTEADNLRATLSKEYEVLSTHAETIVFPRNPLKQR